jgi:hypothetical protein
MSATFNNKLTRRRSSRRNQSVARQIAETTILFNLTKSKENYPSVIGRGTLKHKFSFPKM